MSALAMMLSAALVAGRAPAQVSGETIQPLAFEGVWYGTVESEFLDGHGHVQIENGAADLCSRKGFTGLAWKCSDVGGGRCRLYLGLSGYWQGIYKVSGRCITLCACPKDENAYPTSFCATKTQAVFILRPIKLRK